MVRVTVKGKGMVRYTARISLRDVKVMLRRKVRVLVELRVDS